MEFLPKQRIIAIILLNSVKVLYSKTWRPQTDYDGRILLSVAYLITTINT